VGHHLGIQVHDIGGHQKTREGGVLPPPEGHPYLRNTRVMEEGHLFTIEPGIYFVEMLLAPFRTGASSGDFNWPLIDALAPFGGIRVEDNVVVTAQGHRNLTRERLPN
jgi:Xaa-Pro dipeptidase